MEVREIFTIVFSAIFSTLLMKGTMLAILRKHSWEVRIHVFLDQKVICKGSIVHFQCRKFVRCLAHRRNGFGFNSTRTLSITGSIKCDYTLYIHAAFISVCKGLFFYDVYACFVHCWQKCLMEAHNSQISFAILWGLKNNITSQKVFKQVTV